MASATVSCRTRTPVGGEIEAGYGIGNRHVQEEERGHHMQMPPQEHGHTTRICTA